MSQDEELKTIENILTNLKKVKKQIESSEVKETFDKEHNVELYNIESTILDLGKTIPEDTKQEIYNKIKNVYEKNERSELISALFESIIYLQEIVEAFKTHFKEINEAEKKALAIINHALQAKKEYLEPQNVRYLAGITIFACWAVAICLSTRDYNLN